MMTGIRQALFAVGAKFGAPHLLDCYHAVSVRIGAERPFFYWRYFDLCEDTSTLSTFPPEHLLRKLEEFPFDKFEEMPLGVRWYFATETRYSIGAIITYDTREYPSWATHVVGVWDQKSELRQKLLRGLTPEERASVVH